MMMSIGTTTMDLTEGERKDLTLTRASGDLTANEQGGERYNITKRKQQG
jgi:hypothetical protein